MWPRPPGSSVLPFEVQSSLWLNVMISGLKLGVHRDRDSPGNKLRVTEALRGWRPFLQCSGNISRKVGVRAWSSLYPHPVFWARVYCCVSRSILLPAGACVAVTATWKPVRKAGPQTLPRPPESESPFHTSQGLLTHTQVSEVLAKTSCPSHQPWAGASESSLPGHTFFIVLNPSARGTWGHQTCRSFPISHF